MDFDHVALQVPDIDAAVRWYLETIAGARVSYQDETWALIEAGGTKLAFVVADQHPTHIAWRVGAERLESLAQANGQAICTHRDATRSIYLKDPGGHAVELISYPDDALPSRD
jgi:catechol 2,3-dioxygenase-like lactoylglutathione lyase family enzyme